MANLSLADRAARISVENPSGAKLLLKLSDSKSGFEIQTALDDFDEESEDSVHDS